MRKREIIWIHQHTASLAYLSRRLALSFLMLVAFFSLPAQTVFWTETFDGAACVAGSGCDPSLVIWTTTATGAQGGAANKFYVSCQENGNAAGTCGSGCGTDQSLHIGNVSTSSAAFFFCPSGDCGASYDASGAAEVTNKRAESPVINCSGRSTITISFNYIERGQTTLDDASLWYYNGTVWALLDNMPKTAVLAACAGQGRWTARTVSLPASADNNPSVKIGFRWVNNGDGTGSDPSFAVDDITLSYLTALPIELLSFSGKSMAEKNQLIWETATETGNDFFTIERSTDAVNFMAISDVDGAGNSTRTIRYSTNDDFPLSGVSYYRLKQTDFNGEFSYSNIISLVREATDFELVNVFHSTEQGVLSFTVKCEEDCQIFFELFDVVGKKVFSSLKNNSDGQMTISIPTDALNQSIYVLKVFNRNKVITRKIKI
ncbi:MAG: T9SS type A sorting domain-containing protein [Bacteroidota bacterium]|nr:T9SS type A sorting domain-containing protein [Bacteroidota bacterium]